MKIVNRQYGKVKCNFIWKQCFYSTLHTLDYGKWREHSKSWNSYCNSSIIYQGRKEILLHSDFIWTTKPTSYIFYQGRFVVHKVQILWEGHKIWKENLPLYFEIMYLVTSKQSMRFFQNFVVFLEYLNFTCDSLWRVESMICKVQILWEGHKIWKNIPSWFEITL